jgi:GMP synthase-like glutamine amidotransferase
LRVLSLIHQEDAAAGVFADVIDDLDEASFALGRPPSRDGYDAALVFGGSMNVDEEDQHPWLREEKRYIRELVDAGRPVLGVCLGSQLVAEAAGARVAKLPEPEVGWHDVDLVGDDPVLGVLPSRFRALEWHGYHFELPPGGLELARNNVCPQAFRVAGKPVYGIQFHAEVTARDLGKWIAEEDAPDPALEDTPREISHWNELGRELCRAFLREAEAASGR